MIIYKYKLDFGDNYIDMPDDATLLDVQMQYGDLVLWALIDKRKLMGTRFIFVQFTGFEFETVSPIHIATVQNPNSGVVYHAFDYGYLP